MASSVWVQPISVEPRYMVNRDQQKAKLAGWLRENIDGGYRSGFCKIGGGRGTGKSILTRAVLQDFEKEQKGRVVTLVVDSRGMAYRPFLKKVAKLLVDQLRPLAEASKRTSIVYWLDQLALLSSADQIKRAVTDTLATKYGVQTTAGADLIFRLGAQVAWEQTRSLGITSEASFAVTDDMLHAALVETLRLFEREMLPWFLVIFFDDLDQAIISDKEEDVAALFRRVFDLQPCLSIVHYRSEAFFENINRENEHYVEVPPAEPAMLREMIRTRLVAASEKVRKEFEGPHGWPDLDLLATSTGNPLAYLRWVTALLQTHPWPPPADWASPGNLRKLVFSVADLPRGADIELVERLVRVVDEYDGGDTSRPLPPGKLALKSATGFAKGSAAISVTEGELELLVSYGYLERRLRFQPQDGYRLFHALNLLRPSVQKLLQPSAAV